MKLQDQVCTLEQAKRLKELGVIYEPFFTWLECAEFDEQGSKILKWIPVLFYEQGMDLYAVPGDYPESMKEEHGDFHETRGNSPAFTVAELGVMIGRGTKAAESHFQWLMACVNSGLSGTVAYNVTALAGFVITQLESGNLTPEEVNKRLTTQFEVPGL